MPPFRLLVVGVALGAAAFALAQVVHPEDRGLVLGFIVRIMEPFWFFVGVTLALPALQEARATAPAPQLARALGYSG